MIEINTKQLLKTCIETGGRNNRYELLYKTYGEIIEEYSTALAAQIITNDLKTEVNVRTVRRTKQIFSSKFNSKKRVGQKGSQPSIEPQVNKENIIDQFSPAGFDEASNRKSNVIFKNYQ